MGQQWSKGWEQACMLKKIVTRSCFHRIIVFIMFSLKQNRKGATSFNEHTMQTSII